MFYKGWHSCSTIIAKKHKKPYKPDSVLPLPRCLLFICVLHCCKTWADYPSALDGPPLIADILIIAPHRVYLVSLQPNCTFFLLHWSSYHYGRMLSAMLPCGVRTFLPFFCGCKKSINRPDFLWLQRYIFFQLILFRIEILEKLIQSLFSYLLFFIFVFWKINNWFPKKKNFPNSLKNIKGWLSRFPVSTPTRWRTKKIFFRKSCYNCGAATTHSKEEVKYLHGCTE